MSEALFQDLLQELFQGTLKELRACLQGLDSAQRRALFKRFGKLLPPLRRACRYRFDCRPVKLNHVYKTIRDDPDTFLQNQASMVAPGVLYNSRGAGSFYVRLQALQVGLATKSGVATGFRYVNDAPVVWSTPFILQVGKILLDRPESWVPEVLCAVFEKLDWRSVFNIGPSGVARLMQMARQRHPEWSEPLAPYLGKAMRWDGFDEQYLETFEPDMILAGLEYQMPEEEPWAAPVVNPDICKLLLRMAAADALPRAPLLELTLRRLQSPLRPTLAKGWVEFWQKLEPSAEEYREHSEWFVDMLNAPSNAAVKLALGVVAERYPPDPERAPDLVSTLSYALQHTTQTIAKTALRLLKKLVKTQPELLPTVLEQAVQGLASPHNNLRGELMRWLGSQHAFSSAALAQLQEMAVLLPTAECEPIAHLLPEPLHEELVLEVRDERPELTQCVAAARQQLAQHPNELLRQRLAVLEHYLKHGSQVVLEPYRAPLQAISTAPDFTLHQSPEALAMDIVKTHNRFFSYRDYERIMLGILQFRQAVDTARVKKILTPLLDRLGSWGEAPAADDGLNIETPGQVQDLPALWLAQIWCGGAQVFPKGSYAEQWCRFIIDPSLQRRLRKLPELIAAEQTVLLSTPTHAAGWLLPEVFARRFLALPARLRDPEELSLALYRLPEHQAQRQVAWELLAPCMAELDGLGEVLMLALAPEAQAEQALERLLQRWSSAPPVGTLLRSSNTIAGGLGLLDGLMRKLKLDNTFDPDFGVFIAALRCRFGLQNARIATRAPELLRRLAGAGRWLDGLKRRRSKIDTALWAKLLFNPQPVSPALVEHLFPSEDLFFSDLYTDYPSLLPYILACSSSYHWIPTQASDLAYRYPSLTQRLFEAGVCRQERKDDYYRELVMALLKLGKLPQVDVGPYLDQVATGLAAHAKPQLREQYVDLLLHWLRDGRVTPTVLATALAEQLRITQKGFSYLDQALASLCAEGEAGQGVVLLAIEQVLAAGIADFKPKPLSILLDRLSSVLDQTGRSLSDPTAYVNLEQLAQAKRRTVSRDKARTLIVRPRQDDQLPLEILSIAGLLSV